MDTNKMIIDQLIAGWNGKVKQANQLFDKLGPNYADREIVPGGNSVIYLIGHLTAVNDQMLEAMELSDRLYPELDELFLKPYDAQKTYMSYAEVREKWDTINAVLSRGFSELTVAQWLSRHHYVSDQDFIKEPNRNVLNILISRALHLANHLGQVILVKL